MSRLFVINSTPTTVSAKDLCNYGSLLLGTLWSSRQSLRLCTEALCQTDVILHALSGLSTVVTFMHFGLGALFPLVYLGGHGTIPMIIMD